jgi:hypothetical protein
MPLTLDSSLRFLSWAGQLFIALFWPIFFIIPYFFNLMHKYHPQTLFLWICRIWVMLIICALLISRRRVPWISEKKDQKPVAKKFRYTYQRHPFDDPQYLTVEAVNQHEADEKARTLLEDLSKRGGTVMCMFYRSPRL